MKQQDLRENFNIEIVNYTTGLDNYSHTLDKCVQITLDYAREEVLGFSEWTCGRYIKLNSVWVGIYSDQRDKNNWKTTSELYEIYLTTKTQNK